MLSTKPISFKILVKKKNGNNAGRSAVAQTITPFNAASMFCCGLITKNAIIIKINMLIIKCFFFNFNT